MCSKDCDIQIVILIGILCWCEKSSHPKERVLWERT